MVGEEEAELSCAELVGCERMDREQRIQGVLSSCRGAKKSMEAPTLRFGGDSDGRCQSCLAAASELPCR